MNNNAKYLLSSVFYLASLSFVLFHLFGYGFMHFANFMFGPFQGWGGLGFAILAFYLSLFGIFVSWIVFFLTNKFLYKKLKFQFLQNK